MSANIQIDMSALSPMLHLDGPYGYGPTAQQYAETATSSGTTSPVIAAFDMVLMSDFDTVPSGIYPSPISSPATASPQPTIKQEDKRGAAASGTKPTPGHKTTPKRRRENRYKNAPPSVLSRRRAQNRESQRAYRERKDQRIKDLEGMLEDYKQKHEALSQAYSALHTEVIQLRNAHTNTQSHSNMGISVPFSPPQVESNIPSMDVVPLVDNWNFFPGMTGYPA
ncbi:uncharacterized protein DNG_00804 [Cephalotrichum gorgonifer]|uniref:Putative transcription factor kapC n=1 Tax=Cephalotrichum gorgonifer TaxID=2041049 RepID=A0AAE8MRG9_9PEZI|nr:uncharacterized protein DNG_00804 [Cephalotrichum gorgonifer]